jgi:hypothetical protein
VRAHAGKHKTKLSLGHTVTNIHGKNVEMDVGKMRKHGGRARDSEAGACAGVGAAATGALHVSPAFQVVAHHKAEQQSGAIGLRDGVADGDPDVGCGRHGRKLRASFGAEFLRQLHVGHASLHLRRQWIYGAVTPKFVEESALHAAR